MIIGIDAHYLGNNQSGNERYTRALAKALAKKYPDTTFRLYVTNEKVMGEVDLRAKNIEPVLVRPANPLLRVPFSLPWELYRRPVDLLHVQYNAPLAFPTKLVLTLHDISWAKFPHWFTYFKGRQITIRAKQAIARADAIICGTDFTRKEIVDWYSISGDRVFVTPYGRDHTGDAATEVERVRDKYSLVGPYILHVGDLQPRKNLVRLVKAFAAYQRGTGAKDTLVLAGKPAWGYDDIFRAAAECKVDSSVKHLGYVEDTELPALYRGAELFLYPSLYEGFGFPPLEAMAQGTPVLAANTGSVAEIVGRAALLFDPLNIEEMAAAITRARQNPDETALLAAAGRSRAALFSWETTAAATMDIYLRVLGRQAATPREAVR